MEGPVELMYRPPGRKEHVNITEALDEIFNRLDKIEEALVSIDDALSGPDQQG